MKTEPYNVSAPSTGPVDFSVYMSYLGLHGEWPLTQISWACHYSKLNHR